MNNEGRLAKPMRNRTILSAAFATVLLAVPALAAAHAPLTESSPKASDKLDTAPTEVTLTFGGELDPDGSSFKVTDAGGADVGNGTVDLAVADRNVMTAKVTITDPGIYTVSYVSTSIDGATLDGTFSFGYKTDSTVPAATGGDDDAPDAALSSPTSSALLALIGVLLLLGGASLATRRVALR